MRRIGWVRCLLCAGLLLVAFGAASAQPGAVPGALDTPLYTWARSYGGANWDEVWTVQPVSDGGYVVGGYTWSFAVGDDDYWLLKLRADGTVQWQNSYGGRDDDAADLIYQTADGGYVVTGYTASFGAGSIDMWLLKLVANGAVQWQKTYGGSAGDSAVGIEQTRDGGYIMAGETSSYGAGDWDVWILKLRADGRVQWQKTYGGPAVETTSADPIQQTADGGYIVCGKTASFGAGGFDVWVLKLAANGAIEWEKTYGGSGNDEAHAIRQTSDGGYVVGGFTQSFGAGDNDIWVLKLNSQGAVQWQKTIGGQGSDRTWSIYHTSDGGCVVGGYTWSFGAGQSDFWVLKFAPDGTLQWQRTYGGALRDMAVSIRQTSDGGYIVGGETESFGAGSADFWVLRLDANGNIPGCALVARSAAVPADTQVVGVDSQASTSDTSCQISDTSASARASTAQLREQCYVANNPPTNGSISPNSGGSACGTIQYFTTEWLDLDGWTDLRGLRFHIGRVSAPKSLAGNAVLLYTPGNNRIKIRNDANTRWWGGKVLGSNNVVQNGQAKVYCNLCSVTRAGNMVRVTWAVEFKCSFRGDNVMYLKAKDSQRATTPYQQRGTWAVW